METDYSEIKGEISCISTAVVVMHLHIFVKVYRTVYLNRENFTVWKLYLNTLDF